jgi:iron(II)-dependent oxidoreductase
MLTVAAGAFEMGAMAGSFVYDNELPRYEVELPSFKLDRLLTTNAEYASFIAEGGYGRREWWSDEGWNWRVREDWQAPLYWQRDGDSWRVRGLFDEASLEALHPVTGISWYEAEAYARFRGQRLPAEADWERAAALRGVMKSRAMRSAILIINGGARRLSAVFRRARPMSGVWT